MARLPIWVVLAGCAADVDGYPAVAGRTDAITNGEPTRGDSAVVALMQGGDRLICTGSVIAPTAILTAAHCADLLAPDTVFVGPELRGAGERTPIAGIHRHGGYQRGSFDHDIAVVTVAAEDALTVPPVDYATDDDPDITEGLMGQEIRVVGYGLAPGSEGTDFVKREGFTTVTEITDISFQVSSQPSQPCRGDSGGPAFVEVRRGRSIVVGVHSSGDPECLMGSRETRTDHHTSFIESVIRLTSGQGGLEPQGCSVGPGRARAPWTMVAALALVVIARRSKERAGRVPGSAPRTPQ